MSCANFKLLLKFYFRQIDTILPEEIKFEIFKKLL